MTREQLILMESDIIYKIELLNRQLGSFRSRFVEINKKFDDGERVMLYRSFISCELKLVGEGIISKAYYSYSTEKKQGRIRYEAFKVKKDGEASLKKWMPYEFNVVKKLE